jgi:hypothetical protein
MTGRLLAVPPLTLDELRALGEINVSFQLLEDVIRALAWNLISSHPHDRKLGEIATARLSFDGLVHTVNWLFRYHHPGDPRAEELAGLLRQALDFEGSKRNSVIHAMWARDDATPEGHITRVKLPHGNLKKPYERKTEHVTAADLFTRAREIQALAAQIAGFNMGYGSSFDRWDKKRDEP